MAAAPVLAPTAPSTGPRGACSRGRSYFAALAGLAACATCGTDADEGKEHLTESNGVTLETDLVLIGGEKLQVKGSVDETASTISRGLDPERSGWVVLELMDGVHVRVRVVAVAYVRAAGA